MTYTTVNCKQLQHDSPIQNCNLQPIYHPFFTLSEYSNLLSTLYDIDDEEDDNYIPSLLEQYESSDDESDNENDSYNDTCYYSDNTYNKLINDKLKNDDDQIGKTLSAMLPTLGEPADTARGGPL